MKSHMSLRVSARVVFILSLLVVAAVLLRHSPRTTPGTDTPNPRPSAAATPPVAAHPANAPAPVAPSSPALSLNATSSVPSGVVPATRATPAGNAMPIAMTPADDDELAASTIVLPELRIADLLLEAEILEQEQGIQRFAHPFEVDLDPGSAGVWRTLADGSRQYLLRLLAPSAYSINLGFERFNLPEGGRLEIRAPGQPSPFPPFTRAEQEEHGQLWTPLVEGDALEVAVHLPAGTEPQLALKLVRVNAAFREWGGVDDKIGGDRSGSCNIDVACSAATLPSVGAQIDAHRSQIRSVGAYTLGGIDTCTGALVNNTAQNGRPFFLTANHCGISAAIAPTMVVYWNFQNRTCRQPNSGASGGVGNGPLTQFNSGAILRASYGTSDMTLVELDDPVQLSVAPFFSGWDRSGDVPTSAVGIHHPAVAEKRISFEFNPLQITSYGGVTSPGASTHLRVVDWDYGTTEGGSSGSPLFDQNGRIVGQLHGGGAACGNDLSDYYGRLFRSWSGGGTAGSSLQSWLDPLNLGTLRLDGRNLENSVHVGDVVVSEGTGASLTIQGRVWIDFAQATPVSMRVDTADETATAGEDYTALVNLPVTIQAGQTSQVFSITVNGDSTPEQDESFLLLLSAVNGASLADGTGRVTLQNDDYITPVITGELTASAIVGQPMRYVLTADNSPLTYALGPDARQGMSISTQGVFTWTPLFTGPFTVTLLAGNPAGTGSAILTISVGTNELGPTLDHTGSLWISPAPSWYAQALVTHDGVDAARSAALFDSQSAVLETTLTGPDTLFFWWKVSSEKNADVLSLKVGGVEQAAISGEVDWTRVHVTIPDGPQTVRWTYSKNAGGISGQDAAFLDEVELGSGRSFPLLTTPNHAVGITGTPFSFPLTTTLPPTDYAAEGLPDGLSLLPNGTIQGTPSVEGEFEALLSAGNASGTNAIPVLFSIHLPIPLAADAPTLTWTTGGADTWHGQSAIQHDGSHSARSGFLEDGQESWMETTTSGPAQLEFWWKVSSEGGPDSLTFLLDDGEVFSISGAVDWEKRSVFIPTGNHLVRWRYRKDDALSVGADAGWVDQVTIIPSTAPVITSPAAASGPVGQPFVYQITGTGDPVSFGATGLPGGFTLDGQGAISGTPGAATTFTATVSATNGLGTGSRDVTFTFSTGLFLPTALNIPTHTITGFGNVNWAAQATVTHDGVSAARAGAIGHGQASRFRTMAAGPGTVSFWRKVSSESGADFLNFRVDGSQFDQVSGEVDWTRVGPIPLSPGMHQLEWAFEKNGTLDGGQDLAWVDEVLFTGYAAWAGSVAGLVNRDPLGNPDQDRYVNLMEYALGLSPTTAGGPLPYRYGLENGALVLELDKTAGVTGVRYLAEFATNLTNPVWSTLGAQVLTDTSTLWKVQDSQPASAQRFIRFSILPETP